jgi:hypothetical protein
MFMKSHAMRGGAFAPWNIAALRIPGTLCLANEVCGFTLLRNVKWNCNITWTGAACAAVRPGTLTQSIDTIDLLMQQVSQK